MDKERQHQEDLQRIRGFRLIDNDFMNACLDGDIEATELILQIILNKQDLKVRHVTTQKIMKNLLGRDIWLDVEADDTKGTTYNVEIQRTDKGAGRKRARYHSSILDAHLLRHGEDFTDLPESYVIFITENDVIGRDLPVYFVERRIVNTGEPFNDGEHIIYVNGEAKSMSTELGILMHDFFCTDPKDMHYKPLADKVRFFKEDEKGVAKMCKVLEDMRQAVAEETAEKLRIETAENLIKIGKLTMEEISNATGLSLKMIEEIADKLLVRCNDDK